MAQLRVFLPKEPFLDADAILRAVENSLTSLAQDVKIDFGVTTQTWGERPEFTIESHPGIREVYTEDDIYGYLNRGTAVRYAVMSHDFTPKTRTGFIGSNQGSGGKLFVSRKHPMPGITAREFDKAIQEKWDRLAPQVVQRMIDAEVSRQNRS